MRYLVISKGLPAAQADAEVLRAGAKDIKMTKLLRLDDVMIGLRF